MQPMSEFDPTKRCWVHEQLNDVTFAWDPPAPHGPGIVNWDGLLLDGWWPWDERPPAAVDEWPWSS